MGKGGGCVPSKKKRPSSAEEDAALIISNNAAIAADEEINETPTVTVNSTNTQSVTASSLKVFIVFYSMYVHVEKLAMRMKKGVDGVEGVEAVLYRVPETLPMMCSSL